MNQSIIVTFVMTVKAGLALFAHPLKWEIKLNYQIKAKGVTLIAVCHGIDYSRRLVPGMGNILLSQCISVNTLTELICSQVLSES